MLRNQFVRKMDGLLLPLLAGGMAGMTVDIVLFPLDTMKTRLQSKSGFRASGGFRGIYSGILPAAVGSAPSAATFFLVYEAVKRLVALSSTSASVPAPFAHMLAASAGEMASNLVRVPFEVTKQRMQANTQLRPIAVVKSALQNEGLCGLYRGYGSVILREIPFSAIQFPLWEFLKQTWAQYREDSQVEPWQAAICGACAGGVSAFLTTPLDVAKTRIMLAEKHAQEVTGSYAHLLRGIWAKEGVQGMFAGVVPRVLWISFGGFVFLGAYEKSLVYLRTWQNLPSHSYHR